MTMFPLTQAQGTGLQRGVLPRREIPRQRQLRQVIAKFPKSDKTFFDM